ncbi:MAG: hypothetical protein KDC44_11775 [Phaeodactylibacter sp.]|nr:hypothetical protein [Phaeodactylibacter sp.]
MRWTTCIFMLCLAGQVTAQSTELPSRVNLVFGIGQLTQKGFNIEGNLFLKRFAFDFSHGISLNLDNNQLEEGADKAQGLSIHLPWTTGFGLGYRFTDWLNLRVEPKWHKFELFQQGTGQQAQPFIGDYTTFTLGLGLYANWLPFRQQDNFLKGLMIAPNVRWWPRLSSSLDKDRLYYFNVRTEQQEVHQARQIGMVNTPFFLNVSVGYSFEF